MDNIQKIKEAASQLAEQTVRRIDVEIAKHRKLLNRAVGNQIAPYINYHHYEIIRLIQDKEKAQSEIIRRPIYGVPPLSEYFKDLDFEVIKKLMAREDEMITSGSPTEVNIDFSSMQSESVRGAYQNGVWRELTEEESLEFAKKIEADNQDFSTKVLGAPFDEDLKFTDKKQLVLWKDDNNVIRDGGTFIGIDVTTGMKYYVDRRINSKTRDFVYDRYPGDDGAVVVAESYVLACKPGKPPIEY